MKVSVLIPVFSEALTLPLAVQRVLSARLLRAGYRIHEVPISYNPRGVLEGKKIHWYDGLEAMWTLLRYRFAPLRSFYVGSPRPERLPAASRQV